MNQDSASIYKLYSIAGTCSTAITVLLNKLEQPFTVIQRKDVANYSGIVATNQVPALKADNFFLTEGAAIVLYLLERHPSTMLPGDIKGRAEFYRWLMFNYATLHPAHSKIYGLGHVAESITTDIQTLMQKLGDNVSTLWTIVNKHLATREFMVGDSVSIIDYLITIYTGWWQYSPDVDMTRGEHVLRLAKKVSALPEFEMAFKQENATFKMAGK